MYHVSMYPVTLHFPVHVSGLWHFSVVSGGSLLREDDVGIGIDEVHHDKRHQHDDHP